MLLRSRPVACMATPRPAIPLDESESLADYVVLWWKALQNDVLVLAVRGALLGSNGIQAIAAPVLVVEKVIGIFI